MKIVSVGVDGAVLQQSRYAAMIISAEAGEVVVAKLINHYGHQQLGFLLVGSNSRSKQRQN